MIFNRDEMETAAAELDAAYRTSLKDLIFALVPFLGALAAFVGLRAQRAQVRRALAEADQACEPVPMPAGTDLEEEWRRWVDQAQTADGDGA